MKRLVVFLFVMTAVGLAAKTVLKFHGKGIRNWAQNQETICITVNAGDLNAKKAGADKVWVVLSARYLGERFWAVYPEFTEKCIVGKSYDFKWIEATPLSPGQVTSNNFKITGARGAYYGFVLVEKGGILSVVAGEKIGGTREYRSGFPADAVAVHNAIPLERKWDDDKRYLCK